VFRLTKNSQKAAERFINVVAKTKKVWTLADGNCVTGCSSAFQG